jgi:hypothetical protein
MVMLLRTTDKQTSRLAQVLTRRELHRSLFAGGCVDVYVYRRSISSSSVCCLSMFLEPWACGHQSGDDSTQALLCSWWTLGKGITSPSESVQEGISRVWRGGGVRTLGHQVCIIRSSLHDVRFHVSTHVLPMSAGIVAFLLSYAPAMIPLLNPFLHPCYNAVQ